MKTVRFQRVSPATCGGFRGVVPPGIEAVEVEIKL
jgi:hypothetical protein